MPIRVLAMGYQVWKNNKSWRLVAATDNGKQGLIRRTVEKDSSEFKELGFSRDMTLEQAQIRAKSLQGAEELKRDFARRARVESRGRIAKLVISVNLPSDLVEEYESTLLLDEHIRPEHWAAAQLIIAQITVTPDLWFFRKAAIYNLLIDRKYSPDYCNRLIRVLNSWGYFYAIKLGRAWRSIPRVKGQVLKSVLTAYYTKDRTFVTVPATLTTLATLKQKVLPPLYNWCVIAFWFGLRPHEVDMLLKPSLSWRIDTTDARFPILFINQSKLVSEGIEINKAWKAIPAVEAGQIEALQLIREGKFRRPSPLWFRKHLNGETARSFRKGFNIYFRSLGYLKEDRQKWMGHQSGDMIDAHYEDNLQVSFHKPNKS